MAQTNISTNTTKISLQQATPIDDIPKIQQRLRANFHSGRARSTEYRKNQLLQLAYLFEENLSRFEEAFLIDLGRPALETAFLDINPTIAECVEAYNSVDSWVKPEGVPFNFNFFAMRPKILKQPKGVALIIGPFNFPVDCAIAPMTGAIAAGCACVVKLSEQTPNISDLVAELWPKYMDEDMYQIVLGAIPETTALLDLRWDHILFTGSPAVGKIVAVAAAKHLTPYTLELGGRNPVFLDTNVNLKSATRRLLWGRTFNAGQACLSANHVFVLASQQATLIDALKTTYAEFYPDGAAKSMSVSRIVSDAHFSRVKGLLEKTSGTIVCGGETQASSRFVAPTIVMDVRLDDALMQTEIFGPILPIVPVQDYQEALDYTAAHNHPMATYVFTDDAALKKQITENTQSGAIDMNDCAVHIAVPGLPFGGIGGSGNGAHTGKFSFDIFTHLRSTVDNPAWVDMLFGWRFPPYTDSKIKQSKALKPTIPVPRPGPGIAPLTKAGWFSWLW